jgi:hypothetical protein
MRSMTAIDEIQQLLQRKAAFLVAGSSAELADILDSDFVYLNAAGRRFDRDGYVARFCSPTGIRFLSQTFGDVQIHDHGTFAVATMSVHDLFDVEGRTEPGIYRSLCVFSRTHAGWLWSAGQTAADGR